MRVHQRTWKQNVINFAFKSFRLHFLFTKYLHTDIVHPTRIHFFFLFFCAAYALCSVRYECSSAYFMRKTVIIYVSHEMAQRKFKMVGTCFYRLLFMHYYYHVSQTPCNTTRTEFGEQWNAHREFKNNLNLNAVDPVWSSHCEPNLKQIG